MASDRANIVTLEPLVELSCGHRQSPLGVAFTTRGLDLPRRKDGWYAARKCSRCRRMRAVELVKFGVQVLAANEDRLDLEADG